MPQTWEVIASEKQRFTVNGVFGRMYFYVLKGVTQFSSFVKAEGQATGRGGKLTITGPDNKPAAHVEGDLGTLTEIPVTVPAELQGASGACRRRTSPTISQSISRPTRRHTSLPTRGRC